LLLGQQRWEHLAFAILVPLLAYLTAATKRLFVGLLPFGLLALVYDSMRYVKDVGLSPARIHLCDLRDLDARLFGIGGGTLQDWLQAHASRALDLVCAIPYGTFIYVSLAIAVWLYFRDYEGLRRFGWTFLLVNIAGFVTYHLYPAAPPWYFHAHGCAVDMATHASEGPNLARVDAWLGVGYFAGFYGRSSDVFGAVKFKQIALQDPAYLPSKIPGASQNWKKTGVPWQSCARDSRFRFLAAHHPCPDTLFRPSTKALRQDLCFRRGLQRSRHRRRGTNWPF
jgi:hypothetical protein